MNRQLVIATLIATATELDAATEFDIAERRSLADTVDAVAARVAQMTPAAAISQEAEEPQDKGLGMGGFKTSEYEPPQQNGNGGASMDAFLKNLMDGGAEVVE